MNRRPAAIWIRAEDHKTESSMPVSLDRCSASAVGSAFSTETGQQLAHLAGGMRVPLAARLVNSLPQHGPRLLGPTRVERRSYGKRRAGYNT